MTPEGNISNGKYILPFKKGAFLPKLPITVYFIKYKSRVSMSLNLLKLIDCIIGILF